MPPNRSGAVALLEQLPGQHLAVEDVAARDAEALPRARAARARAGRRSGPAAPGRPRRSARSRVSAAASASTSAGKHWQNSDSTWRPGRREAVVGRGLARRLDPRPRRRAAGAGVGGGRRQVVHREADVDRALPRLRPRPAREVGQAVEQQHHLHHRARLPPVASGVDARERAPSSRGSAFETTTRARDLLAARRARRPARARPRRARARPAPRAARARRPPRRRRAAPPSPRPCRRARSPRRPGIPAASPRSW